MNLPITDDLRGLLPVMVWCCVLWSGSTTAGDLGGTTVENPAPGPEAVERRTVDSKHFDLGGGRFEAWLSSGPLHYLDRDGMWKDIDTSLSRRGEGRFVADDNGLRVDLPAVFWGEVEVLRRPQSMDELEYAGVGAEADSTVRLTPIALRWVDGIVNQDLDLRSEQEGNIVDGGLLGYGEIARGISASYRVIPNGLRVALNVSAVPEAIPPLAGGYLEFVWSLGLSHEATLRSAGQADAGVVVDEGLVQVESRDGEHLLVFTAPAVRELARLRNAVNGTVSAYRQGSGWRLVMAVPAAWLTDPGRAFPLEIRAEVSIQPPSADTFILDGSGNMGTFEQLWVGNDGFFSPSRTLLSWANLSSIPQYALVDGASEDDSRILMYLTDYWGDGEGQYIRVYRLETTWDEIEADWLHRDSSNYWVTPGGDFGSLQGLGYATTSNGYKTFAGLGIRDSVALWRTCLIADPTCTSGEFPYGFLLKLPDPEDGRDIKIFASKEYADPSKAPQLVVSYTDGPLTLADQTPLRRRVPSPDYFVTPTAGLWRVVGIRPEDDDTRYDLIVHTSDSYGSYVEASNRGPGEVDLVVIGQDAPQDIYYPYVFTPMADTGDYRIEFVERISYFGLGIQPGDSFGPYTMRTTNIVKLWSFRPSVGAETCIQIEPTSGDARLGVAVFAPESLYSDLDDALVSAVAPPAGGTVGLSFTASTNNVYGLLVWNLGAESHTDFMIRGCGGEIFSDGFESGNTSLWDTAVPRSCPQT